MKKVLNNLFPFVDFVYILQLEEYSCKEYCKWIKKRFFKRGFQKVGKINWTPRAKASLLLSVSFFFTAIFLMFYFDPFLINRFIFTGLFTVLIPLFVLDAALVLAPIDFVYKFFLIRKAKKKLIETRCKVVAIAGSYGKSTIRHFSNLILSEKFNVQTPIENHNTIVSISDDILGSLDKNTEIYLVELGEYHKRDFEKFVKLLNPEIVVLTSVGPQHLHTFGTQEDIDNEFISLLELTKKKTQFLNRDNIGVNRVIVGYDGSPKFFSSKDVNLTIDKNWQKNESFRQNIAGAIILAKNLGMDHKEIMAVVQNIEPLERRMEEQVQGDIKIIDDTYNINPDSAKSALEYLKKQKGRKVLVTGGIVDQGDFEESSNVEFGRQIAAVADVVIIAKNTLHRFIKRGIKESGFKILVYESSSPEKTPELLGRILKSRDVVLIQNELPDTYWS